MTIGNDIVHLTSAPNVGKSSHAAFVKKVFTDEEAAAIARAGDPDRRLWSLWAAKEAVFKAAGGRFLPREIRVDFDTGIARWNEARYALSWQNAPEWVHCRAEVPGSPVWTCVEPVGSFVAGYLTPAEEAAVIVPASRPLRLLAKRELAARGLSYDALEIRREPGAPPAAFYRGARLSAGISFSHDGDYLALVIGWRG